MMDCVIIRPLILIVCLFNLYLNTITTIKDEKKGTNREIMRTKTNIQFLSNLSSKPFLSRDTIKSTLELGV